MQLVADELAISNTLVRINHGKDYGRDVRDRLRRCSYGRWRVEERLCRQHVASAADRAVPKDVTAWRTGP